MAQELTVVVTGSTGKGGAVARGLLERGHKVRAVTRPQLKPGEVARERRDDALLRRRSKTLNHAVYCG